jgi:hypothetical protein
MKDDFNSPDEKYLLEAFQGELQTESKRTLCRFKAIAPEILKEWRRESRRFDTQLRRTWNKPFLLMESFVRISMEMGAKYNLEEQCDYTFQALTKLHGRACRIGQEVLILLKSGYPVGAFARWRAIHEIAVVSQLIQKNGNELAERYLNHEIMERLASMRINQQYCERLDMRPYSEEETAAASGAKESLVRRYGRKFTGDYGWATMILKDRPPTFVELEKLAGLDHYRPYYRMASDGVHAGSRVLGAHLGLMGESSSRVILAGPSNSGIALPGQSTIISLMQVNISILPRHPNTEDVILMGSLYELMLEARTAFDEVETKLESRHKKRGPKFRGATFRFIEAPRVDSTSSQVHTTPD